ncbi:MAG: hypothetical protein JKX73_10490 [Flavobacteriales bacterium]|nr:hypothetical protein [Flavobacteriales bacterium]
MYRNGIYLLILVSIGFSSCKKEAGDGGLATIEGILYEDLYDPAGAFSEQVPAAVKKVYLAYGDNTSYDDRVDTDANGKYQFKSLQKGEYRLYAFSDCSTCSSGSVEVEVDVTISDKKGITLASDITVVNILDYNDGTGSIQGKLFEVEYDPGSPADTLDSYFKPDDNVYIVYNNDLTYFDKVKTDGSGVFQFTRLIKGSYRIYSFSDCSILMSCPDGTEEKDVSTTITSNGQTVNIGTVTLAKR